MTLFSQRIGLKPIKKVFQIESVDEELKNSLWNAFYLFFWVPYTSPEITGTTAVTAFYRVLAQNLCIFYFKAPVDNFPRDYESTVQYFKVYFFHCKWYEVYDFIEFSPRMYPDSGLSQKFRTYCNVILEQEASVYRFAGDVITQITSQTELDTIEEALSLTSATDAIQIHLRRALELLSDRHVPDYRNSIKESISAIEAICKLILGNTNTTLGAALNEIEKSGVVELHSNLKEAFKQLYWYTSDAAGIRHAIKDESLVEFEDAKFMLVSCSAFASYLLAQAFKAGIRV